MRSCNRRFLSNGGVDAGLEGIRQGGIPGDLGGVDAGAGRRRGGWLLAAFDSAFTLVDSANASSSIELVSSSTDDCITRFSPSSSGEEM